MSRRRPHVVFAVTVPLSLGFLLPVIDEALRRGWRVQVVCSPPSNQRELDLLNDVDIDVRLINMSRAITPGADARALTILARFFRDEKPDIVVGSTPKAALLSMLAARVTDVRSRVLHVWGARWDGLSGPKALLLRKLDSLAAASATDVIAVSDSIADLFVASRVTHERPIVLGRGASKGVDTTKFHPVIQRPHPPTLGFAGRLAKDKGLEDLLTVYEICREVHADCRLVVAGALDDAQPIDAFTQSRLRQPGVDWLGPIYDVAPILAGLDVLVFPSSREGLPNVVIEAAACGVPTVGYRVTGVVDAVLPGVTGVLVRLGDVDALARAALSLIDTDQGAKMRVSARRLAVEHFAQERVVGAFMDYLEDLIQRSDGGT